MIVRIFLTLICLLTFNINAEESDTQSIDPSFTKELKDRRERVFEIMSDNSMLVLFPAEYKTRNNDVSWAYRQTADLFYLTGSTYSGTYLVLVKNGKNRDEYIFHKESDPEHVQWMGILPTSEQVQNDSGINNVFSNDKFESFISATLNGYDLRPDEKTGEYNRPKHYGFYKKLTEGKVTLWLSLGRYRNHSSNKATTERKFLSQLSNEYPDIKVQNISPPLNKLREIKSKFEIVKLQKAIDITIDAQKKAMKRVQTAEWEYQVQATVDFTFRDSGACCPGFPSITASGENTTILHYEHPNAKIEKDKLFLTDIGAEVDYYTADVTRTYPADGTFSEYQKDIYSAVLKAQKLAIKKSKVGSTLTAIEGIIIDSLAEDLLAMGLIDKKDKQQVFVYYPHSYGHSLGMDVHDTFTRHLKLKKNMVITIEPGIYVRKSKVIASSFYEELDDDKKKLIDAALDKYDGIGVRIEDDILIAKGGPKILSKNAPREIEAIEKWMAK